LSNANQKPTTTTWLTYLIALVWLLNGLVCKIFNLVPRHQQIVSEILGNTHAQLFTKLIGLSEVLLACWILSGKYPKLNAWFQIITIAIMNTLEYFLVPDLLLWGRFNSLFALAFMLVIYFNAFHLNKSKADQS
jgi:hypothetical protein